MITEDYVSFETANLLKEKGFNEKTHRCYNLCTKEHELSDIDDIALNNWELADDGVSAPTLQMTMKWLREVHSKNIILDMVPLDEDSYVLWTFNVYCNKNYKIMWGTKQPKYNTYEDAAEAAIKYYLINLIK